MINRHSHLAKICEINGDRLSRGVNPFSDLHYGRDELLVGVDVNLMGVGGTRQEEAALGILLVHESWGAVHVDKGVSILVKTRDPVFRHCLSLK